MNRITSARVSGRTYPQEVFARHVFAVGRDIDDRGKRELRHGGTDRRFVMAIRVHVSSELSDKGAQ